MWRRSTELCGAGYLNEGSGTPGQNFTQIFSSRIVSATIQKQHHRLKKTVNADKKKAASIFQKKNRGHHGKNTFLLFLREVFFLQALPRICFDGIINSLFETVFPDR